jgi:hypothetical protein
MSYIVTRTQTRPNTDVLWYTKAPFHTTEYTDWLNQNWINTGKLSLDFAVSEDLLTMTVTVTVTDQTTWNELSSQQQHIDYQALKEAWNSQHGITQTISFSTTL